MDFRFDQDIINQNHHQSSPRKIDSTLNMMKTIIRANRER